MSNVSRPACLVQSCPLSYHVLSIVLHVATLLNYLANYLYIIYLWIEHFVFLCLTLRRLAKQLRCHLKTQTSPTLHIQYSHVTLGYLFAITKKNKNVYVIAKQ